MTKVDRHSGSSFDSFLQEEGILEEVEAVAIKRVIAWQIEQEMAAQHITKKAMAGRLHTSRSQLDRLLDPTNSAVHLTTIVRAAHTLGLRLRVDMIRENRVATA
jgi:antitoxin HicB